MKMGAKAFFAIAILLAGTLNLANGQSTNGLIASLLSNGSESSAKLNGIEADNVLAWPNHKGLADSAYGFTGDGWVNLPSELLNGQNEQGAINLWFESNNTMSRGSEDILAAHGQGSGSGIGQPNRLYLTVNEGRLIATIGNPSKDIVGPQLAAQKWYNVGLVWSGGGNSAALYVNGVKVAGVDNIGFKPSIDYFNLGSWKHEGGFFHGSIDGVRIYNRALAQDEIQELYADDALPQIAKTNLPVIDSTGLPIEPPTNNVLELSAVTGNVRVLDSNGLLLESNLDYLPRIAITNLSNDDLQALLETKIAYLRLTTFGKIENRNAQSEIYENQLQQIWNQGKSLQERVQTRLEILDDMRAYNADVSYYANSVGFVNQSERDKNSAQIQSDNHLNIASSYGDIAANAYQEDLPHIERWADKQENQEINEAVNASQTAQSLQGQEQDISKRALNYQRLCQAHAAWLAQYGITVSDSPPFYPIPPLSMRTEIDLARISTE